jgi:cytochrome P450
VLRGQRPDYAQIKGVRYLRWVLNECLRLMPVIPANGRITVRDTTLPLGSGPDGKAPVFLPKGSIVTYFSFTFHRRKDLYSEDAYEFRPEKGRKLRPGWEYPPFNGGPCVCVYLKRVMRRSGSSRPSRALRLVMSGSGASMLA